MDAKIPRRSQAAQPSPRGTKVNGRSSDAQRPLTSHGNPLTIDGHDVLGASDVTVTVQSEMERVVRESMNCTRDPFAVQCAFHVGRLVGGTQNRSIVLPVDTEAVLENDDAKVTFLPDVSSKCVDALYMDVFTSQTGTCRLVSDADYVELEVVSSSGTDCSIAAGDMEGFHHTRIYRVPYSTEEGLRLQDLQCWDHNVLNNLLIYRPHSHYHYRLQTSSAHTAAGAGGANEVGLILKLAFRHVRSFKTCVVGSEKLVKWGLSVINHWDVVINDELVKLPVEKLFQCFTTSLLSGNADLSGLSYFDREVVEDGRRHYVQATVNGSQLAKQFMRLTQCKPNRFGYIIAMLRSNLRMILDTFDSNSVETHDNNDYYPNRFGSTAEAAQFHYDTRKLVRQKGSAIEALRRNNNLVKRILIACHVHKRASVLDLACGHCQDLDKYATVGISHVLGIDISLAEIMEARRRYSDQLRSRRFRFKAEFHHGNLLEENVYGTYVRNRKFDVVTIQLAIHYIISDEQSATMLLRNIHKALCDKGVFIGSTVCCAAIAKGLAANAPYQSMDDGGAGGSGLRWDFGNSIFRVSMEPQSIEKLTDGDTARSPALEALSSRLESRWGIKYHFFLMESIDAGEYVVPWRSFSELCTRLGFRLIETFTFPEYLDRAHEILGKLGNALDTNVVENVKHHLRSMAAVEMSKEQQEAFMLYRVFVFEKVTGRDKMYMQGVKIRRSA